MRPRARLPKRGFFTVVNDDLPQGTRYNVPRPSFFYDPKEFDPSWGNLKDAEIVTAEEASLMAAAVSSRALSVPLTDELKNAMRARIMKSMLMTIAARNKG